jgi:hypothetical protein
MPRPTRFQAGSAVMSTPAARTVPVQARSSPAAALMTVDLPAPFEPMMVLMRPRGKCIEA